jgi:hypothetical protein
MKAQNAVISIHLLREEFDVWKQNPNAFRCVENTHTGKKDFASRKKIHRLMHIFLSRRIGDLYVSFLMKLTWCFLSPSMSGRDAVHEEGTGFHSR